jgi:hypothetical protein
MKKHESGLPERLSTAETIGLERRLREAASHEQPSPELSKRMASAIGISMPIAGNAAVATKSAAGGTSTAAPKTVTASSSLLPWALGTLATAMVVIGVVVASRSNSGSRATPSSAAHVGPVLAAPALAPSGPVPAEPTPPEAPTMPANDDALDTHAPGSPQRARERTDAGDLSDQLALVDAAHRALGSGDARGALSLTRKYQAEYPSGTFRPEAAAIRIEALVNAGRATEARALADKFATAYGPGPLADRVAALVSARQP